MWDKLDEILIGTMLTGLAGLAIYLGYDGNIASIAVTGLVALAGKLAGEKKNEKDLEKVVMR
jgi:hypothetical protein